MVPVGKMLGPAATEAASVKPAIEVRDGLKLKRDMVLKMMAKPPFKQHPCH